MLSFFRGKNGSKFVFVFLGLVLLAMVASGVGTQGGGLSNIGSLLSANSEALAKVGGTTIEKAEVAKIAQNFLDRQREKQPGLTMAQLVAEGIVGRIIDEKSGDHALQLFGEAQGMKVSKRLVDAQIAEIAAFNGIDGKFDHNKMIDLLARQNLTEQQFRADYASVELRHQFTVPIVGATTMPRGLATSYAAMFIEGHEGQIATIPASAMTNAPKPNDSQVNAFYARHLALYTLPERRVIEYAVFGKDRFAEAAKPSEAEIAAAYDKDKSKYAAKDMRTLTQVIFPDEAKARAAYDKVKAGTALAVAAKAAGFEAITLAAQEKAAYAGLASSEVAEAVFKTGQGQVAPLAKSPLGWHVVRVDAVTHDPGKSLDQARDDLTKQLSAKKIEEVFVNFQNKLADRASAGARFDELVKAEGATASVTPLIVASGAAADDPKYRPTPELANVIKDSFKPDTKTSSEPLIVNYGTGKDQFALYHVRTVVPSGPLPLAKIREQVAHDAQTDLASKAARVVAGDVIVKVGKGMPLAQAIQEAGLHLPPIDKITASQYQVMQQQQKTGQPTPPPVRALFQLAVGHAKPVEIPGHSGWFVVMLDKKIPGDLSKAPALIDDVQRGYGKSYGLDLMTQFTIAAQQKAGGVRYSANIATLNAALIGNQAQ